MRRGLIHIKEIAALEHETPLTWSRNVGYQLSGTIAPHAAARPKDEFARLLLDQLGGVKAPPPLLTRD